MTYLTPIPLGDINLQDAVLELLAFVAHVFILGTALYARKKNKIFASKGFVALSVAIALGIAAAFMDFLTELYWIDAYDLYKSFMSVLQVAGLVLFAVSLILVFRFTKFLMGEGGDREAQAT